MMVAAFSCDRKRDDVGGVVELYLLEDFQTAGERCAIDNSTVHLQGEPLIGYDDLLGYDPEDHAFHVSGAALDAVENLQHSVWGIAFGVTANGELVYTGYFWPMYSSLSCQWVIIDPIHMMMAGDGTMRVELGYPGLIEGAEIPDSRNDPSILAIFRRDGKLIE